MNVLIVDDHPLIRSGVRAMLTRHDGQGCVREANDCRAALALLGEPGQVPDLILLDLGLPDHAGLSALSALREAAPDAAIVVLSADDAKASILGALDRGAMGFIPKTLDPDLIWNALGVVVAGGIYLPREILGGDATGSAALPDAAPRSDGDADRLRRLGLTERQIETLRMLVQGQSNKAIARELGIAEATVKVYVSAVLRALNVASRTQAVIWLSRSGIVLGELGARGSGHAPGNSQGTG